MALSSWFTAATLVVWGLGMVEAFADGTETAPNCSGGINHATDAMGASKTHLDAGADVRGLPVSPNAIDRRAVEGTTTVRPEHQLHNPLGVSHKEWQARTELAAAYRGLYLHGLERSTIGSDQAAQCLMLRHPENPAHFLMAEWGIWFEEVTASNLLRYNHVTGTLVTLSTTSNGQPDQRRLVETPAEPGRSNTGCIPVAAAIFAGRPDVNIVVHVHPLAVQAVGGLAAGLLPLSQAAFFLHKQVSREAYDFSYETSFEATLQQGFAHGERAMLLNHHGMYAVGGDAAEGVFVATHLTQACEVQQRTLSMAGGDISKVVVPTEEALDQQYADMMASTDYAYDGSREWPGLVRKLMREAPGYNM